VRGAHDRFAQREVAGQHHVLAPQRDDQEAVCGPRADAGHLGQAGLDFLVGQCLKLRETQSPVVESLGQGMQSLHLAS
jgi:hypothetical protein